MKPIYKLDRSLAQADARIAEFKGFYRLALLVEGLVALVMILAPERVLDSAVLSGTGLNPVIAGSLLLWVVIFQVPGLLSPVFSRMPVVIGVIGRYGLAIALLAQGLVALGLVVLVVALTLNVLYHVLVRTVVMSRP